MPAVSHHVSTYGAYECVYCPCVLSKIVHVSQLRRGVHSTCCIWHQSSMSNLRFQSVMKSAELETLPEWRLLPVCTRLIAWYCREAMTYSCLSRWCGWPASDRGPSTVCNEASHATAQHSIYHYITEAIVTRRDTRCCVLHAVR